MANDKVPEPVAKAIETLNRAYRQHEERLEKQKPGLKPVGRLGPEYDAKDKVIVLGYLKFPEGVSDEQKGKFRKDFLQVAYAMSMRGAGGYYGDSSNPPVKNMFISEGFFNKDGVIRIEDDGRIVLPEKHAAYFVPRKYDTRTLIDGEQKEVAEKALFFVRGIVDTERYAYELEANGMKRASDLKQVKVITPATARLENLLPRLGYTREEHRQYMENMRQQEQKKGVYILRTHTAIPSNKP